jgi:hypothetical protein
MRGETVSERRYKKGERELGERDNGTVELELGLVGNGRKLDEQGDRSLNVSRYNLQKREEWNKRIWNTYGMQTDPIILL